MRTLLPLVLALVPALAGCNSRPSAEHGAASDARDIAKVKAAQHTIPPAIPITPQPVSFADLASPSIGVTMPAIAGRPGAGDGCRFVAAGTAAGKPPGGADVFVAAAKFGLIKLDGRLEVFAADSGSPARGSPANGSAVNAHYGSGAHEIELSQGETMAPLAWKSALTIRDQYHRIVYFSVGELHCR